MQTLLHEIYQMTVNVAEAVRATPHPPAPLQRAEVERIVRRTQQHFEGKISSLEAEVSRLRAELDDARRGTSPRTTEALRQQLQFEKRQRLECEEQCQLMTEEHAKLVQTLELRIRKLERQLDTTNSVRGTPRSARMSTCGKVEDDVDEVKRESTEDRVVPPLRPFVANDIALSTDAVNDFLQSIGKELDAINAMETQRSKQLRTLL